MKASILLVFAFIISMLSQPKPFDLSAYRWKNRILLVFAQNATQVQKQLDQWQNAADGFRERQLLVIQALDKSGVVAQNQPLALADVQALRKQFNVRADEFAVVLVGKDGGEKRRWDKTVPPDEIFAVIDAMPMRQSERKGD
ncbi:MAG: DUF4174 domain-containing protein [Cytophagales bacterium]|nr:DUF4174 domain-containing protein [Cytophagales bacterium]